MLESIQWSNLCLVFSILWYCCYLENNVLVGIALVDLDLKCESMLKALAMPKKNFDWYIVSWIALISGYSQLGQAVFENVDNKCCSRFGYVYYLPAACSYVGIVEKVETICRNLFLHSPSPEIELYAYIIYLFGGIWAMDTVKWELSYASWEIYELQKEFRQNQIGLRIWHDGRILVKQCLWECVRVCMLHSEKSIKIYHEKTLSSFKLDITSQASSDEWTKPCCVAQWEYGSCIWSV